MQEATWHEASGGDVDWLLWCKENKGRLARQFIETAENGADVRPFFGSWFTIDGHAQSGYYLGHEIITELQTRHLSLPEIAALADPVMLMREVLTQFSQDKTN